MKPYCPSCDNTVPDNEAQYCANCFEVRPPDGWPSKDVPDDAASAPDAEPLVTAPGASSEESAARKKRSKTIIETFDTDGEAKDSWGGGPPAEGTSFPPPPSQPATFPPPSNQGGAAFPPPSQPPGFPPPPSQGGSFPPPSGGSYGQPSGGAYSSPPPPSYGQPSYGSPPAKSKTGLVIFLLIVGVALFGCMCFGGLLFVDGDKDDGGKSSVSSTTKKKPKKKKKKKDKKVSKKKPKRGLAKLTPEKVRARLEQDGWITQGTPSIQTNSSYESTVYTIVKGPAGGAVGLYEYRQERAAEILEETFEKNPNAAVMRDDRKVLSVILPNRKQEAETLLNKLVR